MRRIAFGLSAAAVLSCSAYASCSPVNTCVALGSDGACVSASAGCCDGGQLFSGLCPGPSDIQCCVQSESTDDSGVNFGENPFYYDNWCGAEPYALPYLDDRYCAKKFPSNFDREWSCPTEYDENALGGFAADAALADVEVDIDTLPKLISSNADVCVVVTRRVAGKPYHKYFCNGAHSMSDPHETWSSSKIFAMSNAAGKLRTECASAGVDGAVDGKYGGTPLGDLATVVCSYDSTAGYSSNSLSSYFHDLGWRDRMLSLVAGDWLGRSGESLGGNYGEASPSDLDFVVYCSDGNECVAAKDQSSPYTNTLSTLSSVEMTRRIAQYRDIPESLRFPNATWSDMQSILYGSDTSVLFPSTSWGGMSADTAIYVQSALDINDVEITSDGRWRIFSKLGAGYSSSRLVGEIISNAYACLPELDGGIPIPNAGYEFSISVRGSVPGDTSLSQAEEVVISAVRETVDAVLNWYLK